LLRGGDIATFEIVPHNNGPADALAGWSVTDVLPPELTLVSMTGTGYNCTGATCTSTAGLANGADGSIITVAARIGAAATSATSLANVAYIKPAANDAIESNVLSVPVINTNPAATPTNNDVRATLVIGPLPATGSRTSAPLALGLVFFGLGAFMMFVGRKPRTLR
jgi:uncharacterized repeat protein (TIGR01451 family)/LPXTG-motif cell wall-anchored protein